LGELCEAIGERQPVSLEYHTSLAVGVESADDETHVRDQLAAAFARDREQDLRRSLTHSGPHRDDLVLKLGGRSLRSFGSAGQQRTSAIALRLLERETLHERTGRTPLVLLDDPFAELDLDRARQILRVLADGSPGQTFLVVPRADDVPAAYTTLARHTIRDGVLDA
jgi:DNA replication and repair protein RecF